MTCHNCQLKAVKAGKDRKGNQRYRCDKCKRRFQAEREKLLGNMYLPDDKAILVLSLLLEGNSIRSIERIAGIEKKTITRVLLNAGEHCEELMSRKIKGVAVRDVEADDAFSKKWEHLKAMLAVYFAYYNFCRIHSSIRGTPAMEAGITKHVWTMRDLLAA